MVWFVMKETGLLQEKLVYCKSGWLLCRRLVVCVKSYYPGKGVGKRIRCDPEETFLNSS